MEQPSPEAQRQLREAETAIERETAILKVDEQRLRDELDAVWVRLDDLVSAYRLIREVRLGRPGQ